VIRRARPEDAASIGGVFVAARAGMTYLLEQPSDDGFRDFVAGRILGLEEVWIAELDGRVAGFMAIDGDRLDHLYVHPDAQGRGIGAALLGHSKHRRPGGFELWVFQKNDGARRFYERHGLELVALTDGRDNMEREPDALYAWRP
jgi:ribosomal protein S18 acetylase RimI-like enzyme